MKKSEVGTHRHAAHPVVERGVRRTREIVAGVAALMTANDFARAPGCGELGWARDIAENACNEGDEVKETARAHSMLRERSTTRPSNDWRRWFFKGLPTTALLVAAPLACQIERVAVASVRNRHSANAQRSIRANVQPSRDLSR
jgi:hypothetical protein